jgi:hypothetical protein
MDQHFSFFYLLYEQYHISLVGFILFHIILFILYYFLRDCILHCATNNDKSSYISLQVFRKKNNIKNYGFYRLISLFISLKRLGDSEYNK